MLSIWLHLEFLKKNGFQRSILWFLLNPVRGSSLASFHLKCLLNLVLLPLVSLPFFVLFQGATSISFAFNFFFRNCVGILNISLHFFSFIWLFLMRRLFIGFFCLKLWENSSRNYHSNGFGWLYSLRGQYSISLFSRHMNLGMIYNCKFKQILLANTFSYILPTRTNFTY